MARRSSTIAAMMAVLFIATRLQAARCTAGDVTHPERGCDEANDNKHQETAAIASTAVTSQGSRAMMRGGGMTNMMHADAQAVRRLLQSSQGAGNGVWFLGDDGANYTLWGYEAPKGATWALANYPANAVESRVNCTRLGLEQPDVTKPQDLFVVQYLSAGITTWVRSSQGQACTRVTDGEPDGPDYWHPCPARRQFICVLRPNRIACGKGGATCLREACCGGTTCCCGSATCCDKTLCCHQGTKCCPKKGARAAYCQNPFAPC